MKPLVVSCLVCLASLPSTLRASQPAQNSPAALRAQILLSNDGTSRAYELRSQAELRGNVPADHLVAFSEQAGQPRLRTGNLLFDGLYAMALHEARLNSVAQIKDDAFAHGAPLALDAYQTGEFWTYVWTRDLSYSVDLGLAGFDTRRSLSSLLFKTSTTKASVAGGFRNQIIQDTGSGGSYPISSDRVVWALAADATLRALPDSERAAFLAKVYPILHDTIELDRRLIFDPADGLYRGEQSFLDWREQTYPLWTKDQVLPIALSKALSMNALNYFALTRAAAYAGMLGLSEEQTRYGRWAADLKQAINLRFYDSQAGLYSTYLLSDGGPAVRARRYDLLGESLVLLFDIASPAQAASVLSHYPVGAQGPSVVWPQDRGVPIYHNQAIWPFVTAYWLKAACKAGNAEAVENGVLWLQKGAAENLSNMENFDFVTGRAEVKGAALEGPVINSRRQLWSVAAYFSMVQDVVFGLENSWEGLRIHPSITAGLCRKVFAGREVIELQDYAYQGAKVTVRLHLPALPEGRAGLYGVGRLELNGKAVAVAAFPRSALADSNRIDVYLTAPAPGNLPAPLSWVDLQDSRNYFGPSQPLWDEAQGGGITLEKDRLVLHFQHPDASQLVFNIYRDGQLVAPAVQGTAWVDASSGDYRRQLHRYMIEAIDPRTGNASHLTPSRSYNSVFPTAILPAGAMRNQGGRLVDAHHFDAWGLIGDTLEIPSLKVQRSGRHQLRVEFSNGSGAINTGITCGVKKLELFRGAETQPQVSAYVIMPQSGDWKRWDLSSPVSADLQSGQSYRVRLSEDEVSRNMSYLAQNARYTSWSGGGDQSYNLVNVASVQVQLQSAAQE